MSTLAHSASAKEIFLWRVSPAVFWSVVMQVMFLCVYLCCLNMNIIHPISWITETFRLLTRINTWLYVIPLASIIFAQGVFCSKEYIVEKPYYLTRFAFIIHLFSVRNVVLCFLHMISGGLTVWLYLSLLSGRYSHLSKPCSIEDQSCLVEGNVFLFASGLWNGFYYFVTDHILKPTEVSFSPIQQRKYVQVKTSISFLLKKSMRDSLIPILCFAFIYYLRGSVLRNLVVNTFKMSVEDEPIDKIFSIFGSLLLFYAWLFSTLFLMSMYSMSLLFNVHLTEQNSFPIEAPEHVLTLCQALSQGPELLTKLAAQDLHEMAYKDKSRRRQVFTLSIPGGHSTNWTNLSKRCLHILNAYCGELNVIISETKPSETSHTSLNGKLSLSPEQFKNTTMRNLATSPRVIEQSIEKQETFKSIVKNEINILVTALCKKPGISYFFGELTELKLRWVVLRGQVVARVAQGLSQLVAVSLTEDTYGVVQDDLPSIITSLIQLKQSLDKLTKSGIANKKSLRQDAVVMQTLTELKSAVKRSVYKITVTFGDYIKEIPLDGDTYQALQSFINMREG